MKNQIVILNLPNLESFMHWIIYLFIWMIFDIFIYLFLKWTFGEQDATIADNFQRKWTIKIRCLKCW